MILDEAEALLDPVPDIEGFMFACLVDASTGMVLASRRDQDEVSVPAICGATFGLPARTPTNPTAADPQRTSS